MVANNVVSDTRDGGLHLHCHSHPYGDVVTNNIFAFSQDAELIRNATQEHEQRHVTLARNIVYGPSPRLLGGGNWKKGSNFASDRNCYWSTTTNTPDFAGRDVAAWRQEGQDREGVIADPRFEDAAKRDFRLRKDSPALALGFVPIDVSHAGLTGDAAWVRQAALIRHRTVETAVAPPAVLNLNQTFEEHEVGENPDYAHVFEENKQAVVRITDRMACDGQQCVQVIDGPGQRFAHDPHFCYMRAFAEGVLAGSFDLWLEPGAVMSCEWRDWPTGESYRQGPTIRVTEDGTLVASGKQVARLPQQRWVHMEVRCGTGKEADATWSLAVAPKGGPVSRYEQLVCNDRFKRLNWLGFISLATNTTTFYLDNIKLEQVK